MTHPERDEMSAPNNANLAQVLRLVVSVNWWKSI